MCGKALFLQELFGINAGINAKIVHVLVQPIVFIAEKGMLIWEKVNG